MRHLSTLALTSVLALALSGCTEPTNEEGLDSSSSKITVLPKDTGTAVSQVAVASGKGSRAVVDGKGTTGPITQVAIASGEGSVATNSAGDINLSDDDTRRPGRTQ